MPTLDHLCDACGIDEAGRGPLAGPVVAAAVILPEGFDLKGIDDSKKLDRNTRETLACKIKEKARWSVAIVDVHEIDELNILWATMAAMERAYRQLEAHSGRVLIDGNRVPRSLIGRAEWVIKGDGTWACIAAASILAKTARDQLMSGLAATYPGYGFDKHFGYATPEHLEKLKELGPCAIHRRTFSPVIESTQGVLCI